MSALTDTVGRASAPGQVGEAGPGGGALQQVTFLTAEEHCASHLGRGQKVLRSPSMQPRFIPVTRSLTFP